MRDLIVDYERTCGRSIAEWDRGDIEGFVQTLREALADAHSSLSEFLETIAEENPEAATVFDDIIELLDALAADGAEGAAFFF